MTGVFGACLLLIAAYQLATGSLALHVGGATGRPLALPTNPRGTRLFALGLVCFGILIGILAWQPSQMPNAVSLIVVLGLIVLAYFFWWSAFRLWKRDRRSNVDI
jgi:hypothetical protein